MKPPAVLSLPCKYISAHLHKGELFQPQLPQIRHEASANLSGCLFGDVFLEGDDRFKFPKGEDAHHFPRLTDWWRICICLLVYLTTL